MWPRSENSSSDTRTNGLIRNSERWSLAVLSTQAAKLRCSKQCGRLLWLSVYRDDNGPCTRQSRKDTNSINKKAGTVSVSVGCTCQTSLSRFWKAKDSKLKTEKWKWPDKVIVSKTEGRQQQQGLLPPSALPLILKWWEREVPEPWETS